MAAIRTVKAKDVKELIDAGARNLSVIGIKVGLTRQRVSVIARQLGYDPSQWRVASQASKTVTCSKCGGDVGRGQRWKKRGKPMCRRCSATSRKGVRVSKACALPGCEVRIDRTPSEAARTMESGWNHYCCFDHFCQDRARQAQARGRGAVVELTCAYPPCGVVFRRMKWEQDRRVKAGLKHPYCGRPHSAADRARRRKLVEMTP